MRARDNPFRTERLGRLAFRHPEHSADTLYARWVALGRRAAIVGPKGSGKTTLLRELGARAARDGLRVRHCFLNADTERPASLALRSVLGLGRRDLLLLDGAGQLPRIVQWGLARLGPRGASLLFTAHAPGSLPTLVETRTDLSLLATLTRELVGAREAPAPALLKAVYERHEGNLREVFLALYDIAAGAEDFGRGPGASEATALRRAAGAAG